MTLKIFPPLVGRWAGHYQKGEHFLSVEGKLAPGKVSGHYQLGGHSLERHRHAPPANPLYMPAIYIAQRSRPPLFIELGMPRPCLINMPPERLPVDSRKCANKLCKHIPQAIGDLDHLTSPEFPSWKFWSDDNFIFWQSLCSIKVFMIKKRNPHLTRYSGSYSILKVQISFLIQC